MWRRAFPQAGLAPADAYGFARLQEFHSYLASTVHVAHAHRPRASRWADEPEAQAAMQRKVPQNMTDCFELIETHYLRGDRARGCWASSTSVADGYLFTVGQLAQERRCGHCPVPQGVRAHASACCSARRATRDGLTPTAARNKAASPGCLVC